MATVREVNTSPEDISDLLDDSSEQLGQKQQPCFKGRRWFALLATVALGLAVGLAASSCMASHVSHLTAAHAMAEISEDMQSQQCVGTAGVRCYGKCCDGGWKGTQCYTKNVGWAECLEKCEATGKTLGWDCEKIGNRSSPACWAHQDEQDCKNHSTCGWVTNKGCKDSCSTFRSEDACVANDYCAWDGASESGSCVTNCETYNDNSSCPTDRCLWLHGQCKKACWKFPTDECQATGYCAVQGSLEKGECAVACPEYDELTCPSERCMWYNHQCTQACWKFGLDACKARPFCDWQGEDGCAVDCSVYNRTTCPHDRCMFFNNQCIKACWKFGSQAECSTDWNYGCAWWKEACVKAQCSPTGANCSKTRCCQQKGLTCYQQSPDFATCADVLKYKPW